MRFYNLAYENRRFKYDGHEYDLAHLQPLNVKVKVRQDTFVSVEITFSTHTFTEEFDETKHDISLKIEDHTNNDPQRYHDRAFNILRYKKSIELSKILSGINHKTPIYETKRGDFIVHGDDYYIFFSLYRKGNMARMHVRSAYPMRKEISGRKLTISKRLLDKGF